jgi:polyhydroxyalkanoate synthase
MHMLAEDIQAGHGSLQIRQSDSKMFGVGRNLALTPGKVVFENELMQLIQYAPSTATVLKRPILIVPPWINKFYILDLTPEKSFIKWCVDQGLTVFVISWVNPDNKLAKKSFEDYMRDGPLAALDVIEKATGEREVNAIGYCVWRPRSLMWPARTTSASPRPRSSPRRWISPTPAISRSSLTRSRSPRASAK